MYGSASGAEQTELGKCSAHNSVSTSSKGQVSGTSIQGHVGSDQLEVRGKNTGYGKRGGWSPIMQQRLLRLKQTSTCRATRDVIQIVTPTPSVTSRIPVAKVVLLACNLSG
jgi:hypothetical protein